MKLKPKTMIRVLLAPRRSHLLLGRRFLCAGSTIEGGHAERRPPSDPRTFASPKGMSREAIDQLLVPVDDVYCTPEWRAARLFWKKHEEEHRLLTRGTRTGLDRFQQGGWAMSEILGSSLRHGFPVRMTAGYAAYSAGVAGLLQWCSSASCSSAWGPDHPEIVEAAGAVVKSISGSESAGRAAESAASGLGTTLHDFADAALAASGAPGLHPTIFLTSAIFLMLSFRVNRAMARWWDGRNHFAELQAEVESFVTATHTYVIRRDVAQQLSITALSIARAAEYGLRKVEPEVQGRALARLTGLAGRQGDRFAAEEEAMVRSRNRPQHMSATLGAQLSEAFDSGYIKNVRSLVALQDMNARMARLSNKLWTIQATSEPVASQKHVRFTALAWLGFLPWSIVASYGLVAVPISGIVGFVVFKLESVAAVLQNPFGQLYSDIPICLFNDLLQQDVRETLLYFRELEAGGILDVHRGPPPMEIEATPRRDRGLL